MRKFRASLVGDSALYGLSAALAKALALLTIPYLTRALSPTGYGIAELSTSTAALITLAAMFAGDIPATRAYAQAVGHEQRLSVLATYVWATIAVSAVVALLLAPLAPWLAAYVWHQTDASHLVYWALVLVPLSAGQAAAAQTHRIRRRAGMYAMLAAVDLLAQLGLAVALVAAGFGPTGVVAGFVAGSAIGFGVAVAASRDVLMAAPNLARAAQLVRAGLPFLPHATMFVVADWVVRSLVAGSLGSAGVAQFALALRIASVMTLIGAAFAMAFGPVGLARIPAEATARWFGSIVAGYGTPMIILALIVGAVGPEFAGLVAGRGYGGASVILPGLALSAALASVEYVFVVAAGANDRPRSVTIAAIMGAAVQMILTTALLPVLGIHAIGPAAIAGRTVSLTTFLVAARLAVSISRPIALVAGIAAAGIALSLQLMVAADQQVLRWATLAVITAVGAALATFFRTAPQRGL